MAKLKKLWASYYEAYDVDVVVVPTLPTTSRPIDDAEPYITHNGRKARPCLAGTLRPSACMPCCNQHQAGTCLSRQEGTYDVYGRAVKLDCVLSIPSISLPAGLATDGMPIGIMFYARPGAPPLRHAPDGHDTCIKRLQHDTQLCQQARMQCCCPLLRRWSRSLPRRRRRQRWRSAPAAGRMSSRWR